MIISYQNIKTELKKLKGKKTLIGGCFDVFHYGHLDFIKKSAAVSDHLIIALEPDEFIIKTKKRSPVHTQDQRAEILQALRYTSVVIKLPLMQGYQDYLELTLKVRPDFIAVSEGDPQIVNKMKQAKKAGAELIVVNKIIKPFSTSYIIKSYENLYRNRDTSDSEG